MIVRSEFLLALLPPAIAVSWVIADATTGLLAADRNPPVVEPVAQIATMWDGLTPVDVTQVRAPVVYCPTAIGTAAGRVQPQLRSSHSNGMSQSALQRLCQAGLKFTSSLPKT